MSKQLSDDARLREAFSRPGSAGEPAPACPSDETIWSASRGELAPGVPTGLLDHVATCASCAESWRMARAIADETGLEASATVVPHRRRRVILAVAALAAGVFLVGVFLPRMLERQGSVSVDEFRDSSGVIVESLLDETAAVDRDTVVLRWAGAPEGSRYTVELADENLDVLHRAQGLEPSEYAVPAGALEGLPAAATVYWRVEATLPDGSRVSSTVFALKLQ